MVFQVIGKRAFAAPVRRIVAELAHYDRGGIKPARLHIFGVYAVIADLRVSENDNLILVGRICQYFLVAGDAGVEYDFAEVFSGITKSNAPLRITILKNQKSVHSGLEF